MTATKRSQNLDSAKKPKPTKQEHKTKSIQSFKQANKTSQQNIPTRQNQDSGMCNFKFVLKGRKKINKIESSLDVEIFLGCFSCPTVFFFLVRHTLFELLYVIYALYLSLHYSKRIWLEWRPHSAADIPLSTLTYHHTQKHPNYQCLKLYLNALYLPFLLCIILIEFRSCLLELWQ